MAFSKEFSKKNTEDKRDLCSPICLFLLIPFSIIIFLLVGGSTVALLMTQQKDMLQFSQHLMTDADSSLHLSLARKARTISSLEDVLLHDTRLHKDLQAQDWKQLLTIYQPLFQKLRDEYSITHFYFHCPNRVNLLRLHKPEKYGDLIDRHTAREAEQSGKTAWGVELGPLGTFTLRVVQPVHVDDILVGYLEIGQEIEEILNLISKRLGVELAVSIHKDAVDQQQWEVGMKMLGREGKYDRYKDDVLIYHTLSSFPIECDPYIQGQEKHEHDTSVADVHFDKKSWRIMSHPLKDVSGTEVGELIILHDITDSKTAFLLHVIIMTSMAMVLFIGLTICLYVILRRTNVGICKQQEALRKKTKEWEKTFNAISDMIFLLDKDMHIVRANQAACDFFQIELSELIGSTCYSLFRGASESCSDCPVIASLCDKQNHSAIIEHPSLDKTFQLSASPVLDRNNEVLNIVYVVKDITDVKRLEEQLHQAQKMEAIGRLASGVAHDFNNILSAINGYSEICLMKMEADNPFRKEISTIFDSGKRAARLTQQLLAFSRKQIIRPELLVLTGIVDDSRKMLVRLLGEDIEININHGKELWPVKADRSQLEQVVLNLAVNARDAMPLGGKLTIETANVSLDEAYRKVHYNIIPGDYVMLTISDNGKGMDEDISEHIFEPFFTTKGQGKGTGLGLATVHGIVKQNNGEIQIYSEPGKGSTFKIYLPRADEPLGKNDPVPFMEDTSLSPGTETILLVEDDEIVRMVSVDILADLGYTLLEAENGEDALHVCSRYHGTIDLLLTDVVMPKMSGPELAKKMTDIYPKIKVLFMSGYTENAIVKHGVLADDVNFIHKPVTLISLSQTVRKVLG